MYSYMIGKVTLQESVYITLEVNNIGYKIYVANPYSYMIDEEVKVYQKELTKMKNYMMIFLGVVAFISIIIIIFYKYISITKSIVRTMP